MLLEPLPFGRFTNLDGRIIPLLSLLQYLNTFLLSHVWVVFMPLVNGASRHGTSIESMVAQHIERLLMA